MLEDPAPVVETIWTKATQVLAAFFSMMRSIGGWMVGDMLVSVVIALFILRLVVKFFNKLRHR